ncbi:hypothetical protein JCM9279_004414 [Rhodotorula babjevae]
MTAEQSTQLLVALLTLPASSLPSTLALPAVADSLSSLLAASRSTQQPQGSAGDTRQLLQAVIARAAPVKGALVSLSLVAHYLAAFLPHNAILARDTAHEALTANARLAQQVRTEGLDALKLALGRAGTADDEHGGAIEAATTLLALVQGTLECFSPQSTAGATAATDCLAALASAYARLASPELESVPSLDSLRLAIVDTAHALLLTTSSALSASSAAAHASSTALDCLKDLLVVLLPPRSTAAGSTALAHDLAALAPGLAATLTDAVTGSVGPTARQVKDLVGGLRRAGEGAARAPEWLERLRRARQVGGAADADVGLGQDKGEKVALAGVEGAHGGDPEKEAELASAISHLLDLFPHLPAPFLRAALVHPTFSSSGNLERATESLVAALLDDAPLPADLIALRDGAAPSPAPPPAPPLAPPATTKPAPTSSPAPAASSRANVHDDDRLFSRGTLLGPKTARRPPPSARASSGGLALDESLKASIIALAEAPSSDEDDDDELDRYGEAFLEGDEDGGPRVKVGDGEPKDGEGSSDEDGEQSALRTPRGLDGPQGGSTTASSSAPPAQAAPARPSAGYGPAVTLTLESAYLANPDVFARDSATRRGKARKVLRERTGLGDEQIEGWRSMLERDAKKMQRLKDKHQDLAAAGNRPSAPSSSSTQAAGASSSGAAPHERPPHQQQQGQQQQQKQDGSSGGGGGGGGGRGGANGGRGGGRGGGASRGRGDGGRKEHDRAKRGRDRKMARMGAAP